ncbi:hypothetical protein ERX35_011180 [Macrococcus equipercicus]|uniref:Uncharacterized protein n=1 Tax=Macrococcus equipercicus TaxID=69967 RepID=A0ABQ6R618_9STAP|nr:hypothetical protein [Macrococcus equipercicus]KAA1035159.1 hypothetical protein ERX35_011180 [Macrococcus equipercicus]
MEINEFLTRTTRGDRSYIAKKVVLWKLERSRNEALIADVKKILKVLVSVNATYDFADKMASFFEYASTHVHHKTQRTMIDYLLNGEKIYFKSFVEKTNK